MPKFRISYGYVMDAMIKQHGAGKNQNFFLQYGKDAEAVLEEEINGMPNSELLDLMEEAGVIRLDPEADK